MHCVRVPQRSAGRRNCVPLSRKAVPGRGSRLLAGTCARSESLTRNHAFPVVKTLLLAAAPWVVDLAAAQLKPKECRCCLGTHTLICPVCHGRGKVGGLPDGSEVGICSRCQSDGKLPCPSCRATGIENYWLWSPKKRRVIGYIAKGRDEKRPRRKSRSVCDAVAGALSGCISRFAVGPLDVLKIRFQVQIEPISTHFRNRRPKYTGVFQALRTIVKEEGIAALWKGTVPGQLLTVPYTAVQFVTLHQCRCFLGRFEWAERRSTLVSFVSGGVAGAAATICSYPFDLLRTTLAAQGEPKVYRGMLDAAWKIYSGRGIAGIYSGLGITLIEIIPYSAIQFAAYDAFHQSLDAYKRSQGLGPERAPFENFLCGLGAGIVSKLATHPMDVVKKRFQVAGLQRSLRYGQRVDVRNVQTVLLSFRMVIRREGIQGLWKGSLPNAGPAAAVTLVSYEFIMTLLLQSMNDSQ